MMKRVPVGSLRRGGIFIDEIKNNGVGNSVTSMENSIELRLRHRCKRSINLRSRRGRFICKIKIKKKLERKKNRRKRKDIPMSIELSSDDLEQAKQEMAL